MTGGAFQAALLAGANLPLQNQPVGKTSFYLLGDVLLIITISLGLMIALVLWAKYLRHRKRRIPRSQAQKVYRESDSADADESAEEEIEAPSVRRRYKYRYKRRGHRSRNPTLAETGGLPPDRGDSADRS